MFNMDHCLCVRWDLRRGGEDGSLGWGFWGEWVSLGLEGSLRCWSEPSVVSPSGAELKVIHPI